MKLYLLPATALLLVASFVPATAETCACTANDGSCSASIDCAGGCIAICPSGGCRAVCSAEEGESTNATPSTTPSEGSSVTASMTRLQFVTIKAIRADRKQIASELTRITGRGIEFSPSNSLARFNFEFKDTDLWAVLAYLSSLGKLEIEGIDFKQLERLRRHIVDGEKMSMCLGNVPVNNAVSYLSFLSGSPLAVTSGDGELRITSSFRDVTFNQIISKISAQAQVKIEIQRKAANNTPVWRRTLFSILLPFALSLTLT